MMNTMRNTMAAVLLLLAAGPLAAQDWQEAIKDKPGYVDFGNLTELMGEEPKVEVMLGGPLITFLAEASREEDPQLADMLNGLAAIRVNVFELNDGDTKAARARVEEIAGKLTREKWERTVKVNDEDSPVNMFVRTDGSKIAGLAVMVVSGDSEAVFINVVGDVDPAALGKLAGKFGVSVSAIADQ